MRQEVPPPSLPGQCTRGFPARRRALHSLSIPSLHTSHRHPALLLHCLTGCWSHCRSEEDLPPSFTKFLLEQKGGRRGQKVFSTCFWQAALVSWPVGHRFLPRCCQLLACSPLLSCTSGTTRWRLKFQRSFHSVGRYQVGRVVWAGETGAALDFRTAGLFYKDSTGAQQLAHCLVWLHVWVLFFVFMFVFFFFCFFILMHTASIWTRLVGGEVFGSHAGGVLEKEKTRQKNKTNKQKVKSEWLMSRWNHRFLPLLGITWPVFTASTSRSCWLSLRRKVSQVTAQFTLSNILPVCCRSAGQVSADVLVIYPSSPEKEIQ